MAREPCLHRPRRATTLSLVHLFRHASPSCFPAPQSLTLTLSLAPFPRTSCDVASCRVRWPRHDMRRNARGEQRKNKRDTMKLFFFVRQHTYDLSCIHCSSSSKLTHSLQQITGVYILLSHTGHYDYNFCLCHSRILLRYTLPPLLRRPGRRRVPPLRSLRFLAGSSRVVRLAAGADNTVDALHVVGISDVTGSDLIDFPPLVRRADPHRLPCSDGAFDLIFSDNPAAISGALLPSRLTAEAERASRSRGAIVLSVDQDLDPATVAALFKRSRVTDTRDVTLNGSQVMLILQSNGTTSNLH